MIANFQLWPIHEMQFCELECLQRCVSHCFSYSWLWGQKSVCMPALVPILVKSNSLYGSLGGPHLNCWIRFFFGCVKVGRQHISIVVGRLRHPRFFGAPRPVSDGKTPPIAAHRRPFRPPKRERKVLGCRQVQDGAGPAARSGCC